MATYAYFDEMDNSVMDTSVMDYMNFDHGLVSSPSVDEGLVLPGGDYGLPVYDEMTNPFSHPSGSYLTHSPVPTYSPGSPTPSQVSAANSSDSSSGRVQKTRSKTRYDPIGSNASRSSARAKKSSSSSGHTSEDDEAAEAAKEINRVQRIGSEQKRRDQLRSGYDLLRDILPQTSSKMSKVVILERACETIKAMTIQNKELSAQIRRIDTELTRTRGINELLQHRLAGDHTMSGL